MKLPLYGVLILLPLAPARASVVVDDVTRINPVAVERIVKPTSVAEVRRLVRENPGPISIRGGGFSMGGQTRTENALLLDMRGMNRVLAFDPRAKTITVEAGITWREIQKTIDPAGLSVSIMQTYSNFTVGGALSVDCHGRYVNYGPLVLSVRSIKVVLADGRLVEASPTKNPEIFYGAIGGYGAIGVIVEASLNLADNSRVERVHKKMPISAYRKYFFDEIRGSTTAVFHNGDIYPPAYDTVMAVTYRKTDKALTDRERLIPPQTYWREKLVYWLIAAGPWGKRLREFVIDPWRLRKPEVKWRNAEASYDVAELEPVSRKRTTYVLQEYFVPVENFDAFVPKMGEIFNRYHVDVLNVSIRHAKKDPGTYLAWARKECFAFVVYYRQGTDPASRTEVGLWTRELIDAVLSVDGAYYLPYQPVATDAQFHKAYPRANELFALKKKLDPTYKFRNKLWDKYLPPPADPRAAADAAIEKTLANRKTWARAESQTFLTLPEWYIVFSFDEFGAFLKSGLPSRFPYAASVAQFWGRAARMRAVAREASYPENYGYDLMVATIGLSFTAQYAGKALWEDTLGRLTETLTLRGDGKNQLAEDRFMGKMSVEYGAFTHDYPWYEFPFWTRLKRFERRDDRSPWSLRRIEREVEIPAELFVQAVWGRVIKKATATAYDPEEFTIEAWARTKRNDLEKAVPGVKVLEKLGGDSVLLSVPRYESFKAAATKLAANGADFVEIAGNRTILVTVIAPSGWDGARPYGTAVDEWPILTEPSKKRVAIAVPVENLGRLLRGASADGAEVDHVFDY